MPSPDTIWDWSSDLVSFAGAVIGVRNLHVLDFAMSRKHDLPNVDTPLETFLQALAVLAGSMEARAALRRARAAEEFPSDEAMKDDACNSHKIVEY